MGFYTDKIAECAERARGVLDDYAKATGLGEEDGRETALADLLGDLMHGADAEGVDFDAALVDAYRAYAEEAQLAADEDDPVRRWPDFSAPAGHPDSPHPRSEDQPTIGGGDR